MATLGSKSVGTIVKLNVNKTAWNFIVVQQGRPSTTYDSSCNGTWLLMEDIYEKRKFGSNNNYESSDIHSYLNSTFINLFDNGVKRAIKEVKIPYFSGGGTGTLKTGSSGLSTKVFLLSCTETGASNTNVATEGTTLGYFSEAGDSKRVAKYNGTATSWHTRSPMKQQTTMLCPIYTTGGVAVLGSSSNEGIRPALVLPTETEVKDDGTIVAKGGAISGSVNIGGTMRTLNGEGYINVGGTLRPIADSQINIGGVLKPAGG